MMRTMNTRAFFAFLINILIALFLAFFVYVNFLGFQATGESLYLLICLNEGLYVLLYLVRTRAVATSRSPIDWGVAFSATFLSTLLRPAPSFAGVAGTIVVAAATLLTIAAALYLNRSIAVVAAERQIKTRGIYRAIRHPMYASEMLSLAGYVLGNISPLNIAVAVAVAALLVFRAEREEQFLSRNEAYRAYRETVRWKFVPFVY